MSSMSPPVTTSATTIYGAVLDDKRHPDISIPAAQISTTLRPDSIDHSPGDGDEGHPGIAVPSKALHTTPQLHTLKDRDAQNRKDSRTGVTSALATVDHSTKGARSEDYHGNSVQTEMPLATPERLSIIDHDYGYGAVESKEISHGNDPNFGIPTITTEPHRGDRVVQRRDAPSTSFFQGSSNVEITGSNFYEIRGNATLIRFGDSQFTDVQRNMICDYIANLTVLPDINDNLQKHVLTQSIISLPRAEAVFNDYQTKKKSGPCFEGTRMALLREMADWVAGPDESRMYVLFGLAGIGKSTVAYTIASRAADLNLLGASFFFSRDEADRNNAKRFFTTIAYQLCVYNETFTNAIGDVLKTERGSAATTKDPQEQLQVLILHPLHSIVQSLARPILVIVDALDECNETDEHAVVMGLSQLVRLLPSFKVILTTRPQPLVDHLFENHDGHKIFRLQDIEEKVVDDDIRLYLSHSFSQEQIRTYLRKSKGEWCASDEDIESLVRVAGRLFIIASTAVLYVLNKTLGDPGARMKKLLREIAQDRTPFHALNHFYSVIVRSAIQVDDGDDDIVDRYQIVVGTVVVVQTPLSVTTLACLIGMESENIYAMLGNLQSVILLGTDDIPRIYHKSFPDYLTDQSRCKDSRLRIDTKIHHTQITTRCFEIMDKHLKRNILGLGHPARFMSNEDGLKEDGITDEQIQEKIPQQLRYACVYWVNHLEVANIEDEALMNGLDKFAAKHMLYWFEVLSLIGKMDLAHHAIRVVLQLLKSTSSDLHQLLSDALRFISKFYEIIDRSALHTYYSALSFTPTDSFLYRRYNKETANNICALEGGPEKWDTFVANLRHEEHVQITKFSLDSTLLVSCSEEYVDDNIRKQGKLKIWDAATGTPISTVPGHRFAVANDFSTVVSSQDNTTSLYYVNGSPSGTMLTTSSKIEKLALSSESSRISAALSDGTVWLWDSRNAKSINNFDGFQSNGDRSQLEFSLTGTRLAYSSVNGIKLRDGIGGRCIADLQCGSNHRFEFSGDGSRIASVSNARELKLWNSESGMLIAATRKIGRNHFAISANGCLLATADDWGKVALWSENRNQLAKIKVLELDMPSSMAFSLDNILAFATRNSVKFYNVRTQSFIHTLLLGGVFKPLAFSPDCTRLAVGDYDGNVNLWDIRGIDASGPPSKGAATAVTVTALSLSRDCSRLACGFGDGTVELWRTSPTKQRIDPLAFRSKMGAIFYRIFRQPRHAKSVWTLGFDPDGRVFASGSDDRTIKLWNGGDGALRATIKSPGGLEAIALSNSVLVATWSGWRRQHNLYEGGVTLWSLDTLSPIHTFERSDDRAFKVSISENSTLITVFFDSRPGRVSLLDVVNRTSIATFDVSSNIHTMTFLPDNSQLVAQSYDGAFLSYNLIDKDITNGPTLEHLIQLPNTPLWHGVPIWHCRDKEQQYFAALFSQHKSPVPVLWIPRQIPVTQLTQASTMIAVGYSDGGIILLRLPTSHIS